MTTAERSNSAMKDLVSSLISTKFDRSSEDELQEGIHSVLTTNGIESMREYCLNRSDRIDFFLPATGFGIEVKLAGSAAQVLHQLWRYAKSQEITRLALVTTRSQLRQMPTQVLGKPLQVIYLSPF